MYAIKSTLLLAIWFSSSLTGCFELEPWSYPATTPNMRQIVIGRCWSYQETSPENRIPALTYRINCTALWEVFFAAVAYKAPRNITIDSYRPMFAMLNRTDKLVDKAMFWSGSNKIAHEISDLKSEYVTLEDTMPGYIFNGLSWCGSPDLSGDGFNYTHCESWTFTPEDNVVPVWQLASMQFADSAGGMAYVLINASRPGGAYNIKSFFRTVEMPRLKVKKLKVLLAYNFHTKKRESCGEGTLAILESDAKAQGIEVECTDEPQIVIRVLCIRYPSSLECKDGNRLHYPWLVIGAVFIVLSVVLILVILFLLSHHRRHAKSQGVNKTPQSSETGLSNKSYEV